MHILAVGLFFDCTTTVALFDDTTGDFTFFGNSAPLLLVIGLLLYS
jgi:hypothetical protein